MAFPGQIPGVPAGLEYLSSVDQLIVKQEVSVFEVLAGFEAKNKYRILNSLNQQAYWAFEELAQYLLLGVRSYDKLQRCPGLTALNDRANHY
ncbi:phospholipid scramblase [Plakobranchus ocellatus]|uniref:Phospholipid scramblase n=1 Tax=Plakobranchus ocellatus TaxID=259542 RepID=A0AAV4D4J6_9GAST|nr:phospholipid scramblase [Plakobranchus ocellatus]